MEQKILDNLKYKLVYPTKNYWTNFFMNIWDLFIE